MGKGEAKAQSAMEYVTTYGWAILVVIVVLAALFQLGVFNSNVLAPRAPPGACQVYRPYGPVNVRLISLSGICTGELPQYVGVFNGQNSYITTPNSLAFEPASFTVSFWIQLDAHWGWDGIVDKARNPEFGFYFITTNVGASQQQGIIYGVNASGTPCCNEWSYAWGDYNWHFVTGTFGDGQRTLYVDGKLVDSLSGSYTANSIEWGSSIPLTIGARGDPLNSYLNASLANIQMYNTTLSANEIEQLYVEGIGGAPTRLQNLVAWWPLNGNANDYSGNGHNGTVVGAGFSGGSLSSYQAT